MVNFQDKLTEKTKEAEEILRKYLPAEEGFPKTLAKAMNSSLLSGGKRIRMLLMHETYLACGGEEAVIEPFMAGMEMIHTHSLIHDDLPALDNDDYRRGRLTTHKAFGEAFAVLSGDALLNYAYEVMLGGFSMTRHTDRCVRALQLIAGKTGIGGMLGGQSVDVENDGKRLTRDFLDYIYENKTSALIEASLMTGAVLAGAEEDEVRVLEKAGSYIGLAFQIRDDILDVTSSGEVLGKPVHSDEKNNKVTYVTLEGLEKASLEAGRLTAKALMSLSGLTGRGSFLYSLVESLAVRRK